MPVYPVPEDSPGWHALRDGRFGADWKCIDRSAFPHLDPAAVEAGASGFGHIGGSEIAGLFGVQPEFGKSRLRLFLEKAGLVTAEDVPDEPGSIVWFGKRKEATIAAMAAELYGWSVSKGGYAIHDRIRGMAASLDYVIAEPGPEERRRGWSGPGALQVKNTHWLNHRGEWVNDEPPLWILLQLQQEIGCAGYGWGAIAAEVGGNMILAYRYAARPQIADMEETAVAEFWRDLRAYLAGDESRLPTVDGSSSTARALRDLYPNVPPDMPLDLTGSNSAAVKAAAFVVAQADKKAAEERYQLAKSELEAELKGHTRAFCDEWWIKVATVEDNPGRVATPGEIIGARKGSRRLTVTGRVGQ